MAQSIEIAFDGGMRRRVDVFSTEEIEKMSCYEAAVHLSNYAFLEHEVEMHGPKPAVTSEILTMIGHLQAKVIVECGCACKSTESGEATTHEIGQAEEETLEGE